MVFFPGARAIHDRGKITAPYPVRFAVAQQKSMLYYWSKHHSFLGVLGIRSMMLFRHFFVICSRFLSFGDSGRRGQVEVRKQVSAACLREIISGNIPRKA